MERDVGSTFNHSDSERAKICMSMNVNSIF